MSGTLESDMCVWSLRASEPRETNEEAPNAHLEGWSVESETAAAAVLTWKDWCAKLQRELGHEPPPPEHQRPDSSLSDRELARLAFLP
jgi:hypothetical protein